jgi:hemolysin activation/secretion protein
VTLHLKLHQRRFQISIGANDFGQRGLGTAQADATLSVNGLVREGDLTQVTVLGSPADRRLRYIAVNRSDPIGDATITLTGSYLRTNVVGVEGRAYSGAIQIAYPLLRTGTDLVSVSAALDGLNNSNAFIGETIASDRSRAVRASIVYVRQMPTVEWSLMASLSRGVDILGARTLTPQISDLTFTKATFDFDVSVALATRLTARLKAAGQYSTDRLPSVEQLALGGPTTARAFRSVTAIGDRGLYGSVELARSVATKGSADTLEVYGYADAGRVRYLGRLGFAGVDQTLASAGVGARTAIAAGIAADFFVARALFQEPELQPHPWRLGAALRFTR